MPEKNNDSRFLAMLERRGIVRKADYEDDASAALSSDVPAPPVIEQPPEAAPVPIPTSRQPVPGMLKPVFSDSQPQTAQPISAPSVSAIPVSSISSESIPSAPIAPIASEPLTMKITSEPTPVSVPVPTPPPSQDISAQLDTISSESLDYSSLLDTGLPPSQEMARPEAPMPHTFVEYEQPTEPAVNHIEKYLDINELYEALSLVTEKTHSIYLAEDYLNTLPDTIPYESRREIVNKLIQVSGFDYDGLVRDGVLRVKTLKDYAERFTQYTNEFISGCEAELDNLEQQMMRIRRIIEDRRNLHKKQFFTIETEAQRLKDIITFISG